ncbi:hypothetical protein LR48_Vigan192s002800 [Vigna angularis]|uniref:Uncharacterized protein n=1 Tax=Phaseolus angularis TaxID=3914 RepID=A0A0L9T5E7_PHAAN|nr:hypothetical protein LR48_Vigan192s002800 [Vigna angularis]
MNMIHAFFTQPWIKANDALLAQNKILTQQLENHTKTLAQLPKELKVVAQVQIQLCELCGGAKLQSIHRGQVATTEMIVGMCDAPPAHRWTMKEFHNVVAWPEEQVQGDRAEAAEASTMEMEEDDADDDEDDAFEDAEDEEEEEDTYDSSD